MKIRNHFFVKKSTSKSVTRSGHFDGTANCNFKKEFVGNIPCTSLTFTCWAKSDVASPRGFFWKLGRVDYYSDGTGVGAGLGGREIDFGGKYFTGLAENVSWLPFGVMTKDIQQWHHYAVVFDGSRVRGYVDGVLFKDRDTPTPRPATEAFYIGGYPRGSYGSRGLDGKVTRVCYWNRSLTGAEIADDYAKQGQMPDNTDGLVHSFDFSTDADGKLLDKTGDWHMTPGPGVSMDTDTPWNK